METELITLAHSCRELSPIIDIVTSLGDATGLPKDFTLMHVSIHEDNAGVLILAQTLPSQYTPQSKHYAVNTV